MNLHVNDLSDSFTQPNLLPILATSNIPLRSTFTAFAQSLNLTSVKYKLIKEGGWTLERANKVEPQYKAFLFLIGTKSGHMLVPTFDIDEMWHAHILDTRKYMADCARFFGEYIHHYPFLGLKDDADQARAHHLFDMTCKTISESLGINLRSLEASDCGGGCGGGGSSCGGGGSSCSGGSSCGGGGHGGGHSSCSSGHSHHTPSSNDMPYTPGIISSCGGSSDDTSKRRTPDRTPNRTPSRTPDPPPRTPPSRPPERKRGIFRRILGLSPMAEQDSWHASVTPELFTQDEFRPDDAALESLTARKQLH